MDGATYELNKTLRCGRFRIRAAGRQVIFSDRLTSLERTLPRERFSELRGRPLQVELLRVGLIPASLPVLGGPVAERPRENYEQLFWQFPCRTEAHAATCHANVGLPPLLGTEVHCYLGLPWATWLDQRRVDSEQIVMRDQCFVQELRIDGWAKELEKLGIRLRVHTVCQHIRWMELLSVWERMHVTDAWVSHAASGAGTGLVTVHPWSLYPINIEDPARRAGLTIGVDPTQKRWLASFIGAHADHYVTDARLRLMDLADEDDMLIDVKRGWHLEDVVYGHQVQGHSLEASYRIDESVARYNEVLSSSIFSLCPAGAGANTIRLWESLAAGSVPVVIGPVPELPRGGSLAPIDWESIIIFTDEKQVSDLPGMLREIPTEEIRRRQDLGMQAYAKVREQICFPNSSDATSGCAIVE
jgi:hypothetical protein